MNIQKQIGQSLIEILVAIGLAAILIPALFLGLLASREGRAQRDQRLDASFLVKEATEAVRSVKKRNWNSFALNGIYHPEILGSFWVLGPGQENINGFTRQVIISNILRDNNGNIVQGGGSIDPSTKKIEISVTWASPISSSVTSTFYLTRSDNNIYTETSTSDFNAGSKNGVTVTNTSGGEVILGAGGYGDWCNPNLSISSIDLPKQGVANAISAIEGQVIAGTGENASGVSFAKVDIGNTNPPIGTISGTFNGYKTNDVFIEGNYGYIATDTNEKEIIILDISSVPYAEVGYFNASGSTDANSVFVVGNVGYMIQGSRLITFDLSSKTGSRPALDPDGISLPGSGSSVYVLGNYAYVSLTSSSKELQIVNVGTPNNLTLLGYGEVDPQHINDGDVARDVYVNQTATRAYIVIDGESDFKEFFIFDTTTKTGNRPLVGSYEANGMSPKAVEVVTGNKAIIVGTGGEEYQTIDLTNESMPTRCGGMQVNVGINDVTSLLESDGDTYSYILTRDANAELRIIKGGPGGLYSTSGNFESQTFDATSSSTFNRFYANANKPQNTNINYQIGIANAVLGSCNNVNFTFIGPDLTSNTYFSTDSAIPLKTDGAGFRNPGQCLRYKAYLSTTDLMQTPILYDINFNYSP